MPNELEMRQRRASLIEKAAALLDWVAPEGRTALNDAEKREYLTLTTQADALASSWAP